MELDLGSTAGLPPVDVAVAVLLELLAKTLVGGSLTRADEVAGEEVAVVAPVVAPVVVLGAPTDPISEAGIALPTPVAVHCGGIDSDDVLGFAEGSSA